MILLLPFHDFLPECQAFQADIQMKFDAGRQDLHQQPSILGWYMSLIQLLEDCKSNFSEPSTNMWRDLENPPSSKVPAFTPLPEVVGGWVDQA